MQEENLETMVIVPAEKHLCCMHSKFSKNLYRCCTEWIRLIGLQFVDPTFPIKGQYCSDPGWFKNI